MPFNRYHLKTILPAALLFSLNAVICIRLFATEYTQFFHSVEGSFIAIARVLVETGSRPAWWPLWNAGMPVEYAYFPFLPAMAAATSVLTGMSPALAWHVITAVAYAAGPAAWYWFAHVLSGDRGSALIAGLLSSLIPFSLVLSQSIREESGSLDAARRLFCLVYFGEGPHIAAMATAPIALGCLLLFARNGRVVFGILAVTTLGATVLTNSFGAVTLLFGVICLLLSGTIPPHRRAWIRAACAGVFAYALICHWLPPSMLRVMAANPGREGDGIVAGRAAGQAVLFGGMLLLSFGLRLRKTDACRHFALLFGWWCIAIPVLYFAMGWNAMPQPWRYQIETDFGAALATGLTVWPWVREIRYVRTAAMIAALAQAIVLTRYGYRLIVPTNPATRLEYRMSKAFERLAPGERVMAPGSVSLWLNAFTDVPQLSGGHNPMAINFAQQIGVYTVYTGQNAGSRDADISLLWLKAFGASAVGVTQPGSQETYKPFQDPFKFRGKLEEIWREGSDVICRVPLHTKGLAAVVPQLAVVQSRPVHGLDTAELEKYVSALEESGGAEMRWENPSLARIHARTRPGEVISVQMNYAPGWIAATASGTPIQVSPDGLGLIVINPPDGSGEIVLQYTGGAEAKMTRIVQAAAAFGLLMAVVWPRIRARRPKQIPFHHLR